MPAPVMENSYKLIQKPYYSDLQWNLDLTNLYWELLGLTEDIFQVSQSYSKMYRTETRYNEPQ